MINHRWIAAAVLLLVTRAVEAQQRPMSLVDLLSLPAIGDASMSADGRRIAYTISRVDWARNRTVGHIWRYDRASNESRQITNGDDESGGQMSHDGRQIAFLGRTAGAGATQILAVGADGGTARPITHHATSIRSFAWGRGDSTILFLANDADPSPSPLQDSIADLVLMDSPSRPAHLWRVDVANGSERRLTAGAFTVSDMHWSRDGTRILHRRGPSAAIDSADASELWLMNADGTGARRITDNAIAESNAELSPDNTTVVFIARVNDALEPYHTSTVFVQRVGESKARRVTRDFRYDVERVWWSARGTEILLQANTGVRTELFALPLDGGVVRQLTHGDHALSADYIAAADEFVMLRSTTERPADLWTMHGDGKDFRAATRLFDDVGRTFRLPRADVMTWRGADGATIEGIVYYPPDYVPGHQYPLVVQLHGGPDASDQLRWTSWSDYIPVLAARGYVVFKPNYRGSTGYGDEFFRGIVGKYFAQSHTDVLAGVDMLVRAKIADSTRLVVMGWSAGGAMTNKLITYTPRFKAASSGAGIANWVSLYAQTDARSFRTPWFGGTPWQHDAPIDAYWDNSPIKYVANARTPTMFLAGQNDDRVPLSQALEMYRALRSNGVPTQMYVAPREGHGWREPQHRLFKANAELAWFARWLGEAYSWERVPDSSPAAQK